MEKQITKLRRDIRSFGKLKGLLAIPFIFIGIWGLILPIIPGTVFLFLGVVLLVPSLENKMKNLIAKKSETK